MHTPHTKSADELGCAIRSGASSDFAKAYELYSAAYRFSISRNGSDSAFECNRLANNQAKVKRGERDLALYMTDEERAAK